MLKKTHKSNKKTVKKKIPTKKIKCSACEMKYGLSIHIQNALCRKYSSFHFSYVSSIDQMVNENATRKED